MLHSLSELLIRDLTKIQAELGLYEDEKLIWKTTDSILNSAGNLALHIAGNLQHFIGSVLGDNGYVRQRELEFSSKDIPVTDVIEELDRTKMAVSSTLDKLNEQDLSKSFPVNVFGHEMTTELFLLHLLSHTSYHLGQINYHRRLLNQ